MDRSFFMIYYFDSLFTWASFIFNKCIADETVTIIKAVKTKNDICIPPFLYIP